MGAFLFDAWSTINPSVLKSLDQIRCDYKNEDGCIRGRGSKLAAGR